MASSRQFSRSIAPDKDSSKRAQANQIRGLLAEYGIVIPKGIVHIGKRLPEILEDGENELPDM
jgi:transposase